MKPPSAIALSSLSLAVLFGQPAPTGAGTIQYRYDTAGRLVSVSSADGTMAACTYDPSGTLLCRAPGSTRAAWHLLRLYVSLIRLGRVSGPGVDCLGPCNTRLEAGTTAPLAADGISGSGFLGWAGDLAGGTNPENLYKDKPAPRSDIGVLNVNQTGRTMESITGLVALHCFRSAQ